MRVHRRKGMADSENFQHEPEVIGSESRIYRQKDMDAAVKQARAEVIKLLDEYGDHTGACDVSNTVCTCGWEKARAILEKN